MQKELGAISLAPEQPIIRQKGETCEPIPRWGVVFERRPGQDHNSWVTEGMGKLDPVFNVHERLAHGI